MIARTEIYYLNPKEWPYTVQMVDDIVYSEREDDLYFFWQKLNDDNLEIYNEDSKGICIKTEYDEYGRIIKMIDSEGGIIEYEFFIGHKNRKEYKNGKIISEIKIAITFTDYYKQYGPS